LAELLAVITPRIGPAAVNRWSLRGGDEAQAVNRSSTPSAVGSWRVVVLAVSCSVPNGVAPGFKTLRRSEAGFAGQPDRVARLPRLLSCP